MCWERRNGFLSVQFVRVGHVLAVVMVVLGGAGSRLFAQIEPALPGSVEYTLRSNGESWIETSDPIITGSYVEDLLTDRANQPAGRGMIGIVTATGFDEDYGVDAATVDFGRDYLAGIVFPELSAVEVVPEPAGAATGCAGCIALAAIRRRVK